MGKVVPLIVVVLVAVGGGAAGHFLRPPPEEGAAPVPEEIVTLPEETVTTFRNGFIVPVLRDGRVWSHVVLTLGVASDVTSGDVIVQREPILRDGMTEALFLHGSLGGFDGDFTEANALLRLRERLDAMVRVRLDDPTARVLIVSMARQST